MRRRDFLATSGGGLLLALQPPALRAAVDATAPPVRGLRIAVDPRVGAEVRSGITKLLVAAGTHPLLNTMQGSGKPVQVDTAKLFAAPEDLAFNHVIAIGRPDDPLIIAAWQREALFSSKGGYIFGFGAFQGDIGYAEADRNPFLHAANIKAVPYETEFLTLTGTTDAGIALAVRNFTERSLTSGVTAAPGWKRTETTLLDRDPLVPTFDIPALAPEKIGAFTRIAVTQSSEDEYRGVLDDTGVLPLEILRFKYFRAGAWDGKGAATSFDAYANGLHRRAYGSTLWLAKFASAAEAGSAAPKIAAAAKLTPSAGRWTGAQPPYANGVYPGERKSAGPITLTQQGEWLVMSTLDESSATSSAAATSQGANHAAP